MIKKYKVPGGKLLVIEAEYLKNSVSKLKITGDFFIYPEEKITEIESFFSELIFPYKTETVLSEFHQLFSDIQLIGIDPLSILNLLEEMYDESK